MKGKKMLQLKCIKDLNMRPKTIQLIEENRETTSWHRSWQWYLGYDTKSTATEAKLDKW
jgi:hypothetical protein